MYLRTKIIRFEWVDILLKSKERFECEDAKKVKTNQPKMVLENPTNNSHKQHLAFGKKVQINQERIKKKKERKVCLSRQRRIWNEWLVTTFFVDLGT